MNEHHKLKQETEAAKVLTANLRDIVADHEDDELLRDMVEGETSLHEAIEKAALQVMDDRAREDSLSIMIGDMQKRKARYAQRQQLMRSAILSAMEAGHITDKMEFPFATISTSKKARALEIVDEAEIPADYFKPQDPKLDKKAVADALKEGATIPGATLDNGGINLVIRWA